MAKGIIYIMTTVVDGLIKIGKTQTKQFETRMQHLENNGYRNVTGLKRKFAIEVDDYDEKEVLLNSIFDRSKVPGTELFALDVKLAIQLLSAFEGKQIYPTPEEKSKNEVFDEVTEQLEEAKIPEGTYYLERVIKEYDSKKPVKATMEIKNGKYTVLKGSDICPITKGISKPLEEQRKKAKIKNNKLMANETFTSSTKAAQFVIGRSENGRSRWKNKNGHSILDLIKPNNDDD